MDILVRITGLEPARHGHQILNLARLPIPPYPHNLYKKRKNKMSNPLRIKSAETPVS